MQHLMQHSMQHLTLEEQSSQSKVVLLVSCYAATTLHYDYYPTEYSGLVPYHPTTSHYLVVGTTVSTAEPKGVLSEVL